MRNLVRTGVLVRTGMAGQPCKVVIEGRLTPIDKARTFDAALHVGRPTWALTCLARMHIVENAFPMTVDRQSSLSIRVKHWQTNADRCREVPLPTINPHEILTLGLVPISGGWAPSVVALLLGNVGRASLARRIREEYDIVFMTGISRNSIRDN
jgi:hypothetical protein